MRCKQFVRFSRKFEAGWVRGYVLDVGTKFALLAIQSDQMRFDGFGCFRIADVRGLKPDPYTAFAEAALKRLGERRPKKPKVSVASVEELLLSATKAFPLITIHRETVDPGVCWIGKVREIKLRSVSLMEIGPDAKWDKEPNSYKLTEITSVQFGGGYETALHLVGGEPPR